jgi:hypothetical protein
MQQRPHHKFWPKRLPHALTVPSTSLWDNLAISARRYPDKPALVFFGRVLTYAQLRGPGRAPGGAPARLGVRKGDRVVLDMQNCPQLVIAHFAILRANAVVVPVNPMNRAEELKHYITDPDARVAIVTGDLAADMAKAAMRAAARAPGAPDRHAVHRCLRPGRQRRRRAAARLARLAAHAPPAAALAKAARCTPGPTRWPTTCRCPSWRSARTTWPCCPTPAAPPACPRAACTRTAASCTTRWPGRCLGQRHGRQRRAAGGAHVPHHRHGERDAHQHLAGRHLVLMPRWDRDWPGG